MCMFAGISSGFVYEDVTGDKKEKDAIPSTPTPPPQRRLAKSLSVAPSAVTKGICFAQLACFVVHTCFDWLRINFPAERIGFSQFSNCLKCS